MLFYQVYSHNFLCNRMFYLQAGIHFQKVVVTVFVYQEFNCSRTDIVDGFGGSYCLFAHIFA